MAFLQPLPAHHAAALDQAIENDDLTTIKAAVKYAVLEFGSNAA